MPGEFFAIGEEWGRDRHRVSLRKASAKDGVSPASAKDGVSPACAKDGVSPF